MKSTSISPRNKHAFFYCLDCHVVVPSGGDDGSVLALEPFLIGAHTNHRYTKLAANAACDVSLVSASDSEGTRKSQDTAARVHLHKKAATDQQRRGGSAVPYGVNISTSDDILWNESDQDSDEVSKRATPLPSTSSSSYPLFMASSQGQWTLPLSELRSDVKDFNCCIDKVLRALDFHATLSAAQYAELTNTIARLEKERQRLLTAEGLGLAESEVLRRLGELEAVGSVLDTNIVKLAEACSFGGGGAFDQRAYWSSVDFAKRQSSETLAAGDADQLGGSGDMGVRFAVDDEIDAIAKTLKKALKRLKGGSAVLSVGLTQNTNDETPRVSSGRGGAEKEAPLLFTGPNPRTCTPKGNSILHNNLVGNKEFTQAFARAQSLRSDETKRAVDASNKSIDLRKTHSRKSSTSENSYNTKERSSSSSSCSSDSASFTSRSSSESCWEQQQPRRKMSTAYGNKGACGCSLSQHTRKAGGNNSAINHKKSQRNDAQLADVISVSISRCQKCGCPSSVTAYEVAGSSASQKQQQQHLVGVVNDKTKSQNLASSSALTSEIRGERRVLSNVTLRTQFEHLINELDEHMGRDMIRDLNANTEFFSALRRVRRVLREAKAIGDEELYNAGMRNRVLKQAMRLSAS